MRSRRLLATRSRPPQETAGERRIDAALLERTNEDLRQRLDASEAERRNVQTQLNALISATPVTPIKSAAPAGPAHPGVARPAARVVIKGGHPWWRRWFRHGRCRALMLSA